ncbi:MAG: Tol-Pal system beta propeller repeat protein TolB [Gammaproteobacteria bacterium]|nr:Tol-Pal system beta propeller repeat protein TolB [Gammaproteobacteria bacterium]
MLFRLLMAVIACAGTLSVFAQTHNAEVPVIKIPNKTASAIKIAVAPFGTKATQPAEFPFEQVISDDLSHSGRFAPVPPHELPRTLTSASDIQLSRWTAKVDYLVVGDLTQRSANRYLVQFRLFDVPQRKELRALGYERTHVALRITAHDIADEIYEAITGDPGAFSSRIAYITERGRIGAKRYALTVADSDGFNANVMLESSQPIMSPAWSPDGSRLAYVSFEKHQAQIWVQELQTRRRFVVAQYPGINGAPAFSPDGTRLALTLSKDGNPEIYVLHLRTKRLRRLTNHPAIDTEPAWKPDGRAIVFTSDRSGSPQIYKISANGGPSERVTFEGNYSAGASYSPDGTRLAVVYGVAGGHSIAILDLDTQEVDVLTSTQLDDSPTFAPNGTMILYSTKRGGGNPAGLVAITAAGDPAYRLESGAYIVRDPAWGPRR